VKLFHNYKKLPDGFVNTITIYTQVNVTSVNLWKTACKLGKTLAEYIESLAIVGLKEIFFKYFWSFKTQGKIMPQRTNQPKTRRRARKIGFRARMSSAGGRKVIKARREKGRTRLAG